MNYCLDESWSATCRRSLQLVLRNIFMFYICKLRKGSNYSWSLWPLPIYVHVTCAHLHLSIACVNFLTPIKFNCFSFLHFFFKINIFISSKLYPSNLCHRSKSCGPWNETSHTNLFSNTWISIGWFFVMHTTIIYWAWKILVNEKKWLTIFWL
jgi:hypothetical protein